MRLYLSRIASNVSRKQGSRVYRATREHIDWSDPQDLDMVSSTVILRHLLARDNT